MTEFIKRQEGFTLMEAVVSIAVIAVISWFILEIFIVSANANVRARDMDMASVKTSSLIEEIKSLEYLPETGPLYFNDDWEETTREDARFEVYAIITAARESEAGVLADIEAAAFDLRARDGRKELVRYETKAIFRGGGL